jgi:hypothetical protein
VESKLGPLGTLATEWPVIPAPGDYDDGEFCGMKIGRGNQSTRRKPAPAPLCPPQIPLDPGRRGGKPATNRLSYGAALTKESVTPEIQKCIENPQNVVQDAVLGLRFPQQ